ncbi:OsmC family protein [Lacibacterium aquatile]|uniref:OsmC family protein n=1 Tax=Lacibacterium aquatile TaxID=1168082 RepID=A0ABW5DXG3_9PROT
MGSHIATITWQRQPTEAFTDSRYSRAHLWQFDGGVEVAASASPHNVPLPYSVEANVDPEEAFVAAISSCHLLTFLWVAAKRGVIIDSYRDEAVGVMTPGPGGHLWVSRVTLNPKVTYGGQAPDRAMEEALHHAAHEQCFIANSVKTEIVTRL